MIAANYTVEECVEPFTRIPVNNLALRDAQTNEIPVQICNPFRCQTAAAYGHLSCLKLAHESDYDWGLTSYWAAVYGYLGCLAGARLPVGRGDVR